jgi:hypothetical protein
MTNNDLLKKNIKRLLQFLLIIIFVVGVLPVVLVTMEYTGYHKSTGVAYCMSHMRTLQYVLVQFYFDHGFLPAYTVDENNKPLHSWRVLLLPYIEEEELYKKIHLDEPWNSEYNSQFHDYVIPLYHCPVNPNRRKPITNYFFITGRGSLFNESGKYFANKSHVLGMIIPTNSREIGTKKILLVESSKETNWMCPVDITFDEYNSDKFKPATDAHFHIINSEFSIERLKIAPPFYWHWTKSETLLICVLFTLCVIVILQVCYTVVLLLLCIRSRMIYKK